MSTDIVATRCAYCDSPLIDGPRASSAVDAIVPFRLSKAAALQRLRTHIGDRWWTPTPIRRLAQRDQLRTDDVVGVLVPFYAYDATMRGDYSARVGVHWERREKVERKRKRDKAGESIHIDPEQAEVRVVQETEWFDLRGSVGTQLEQHLVCASTGLSAPEARALPPFDLGRSVPFDPRLMLGWSAELPSKTRRDVDREARQTLSDHARDHLRRHHLAGDAHRVRTLELDVDIHRVQLVLLPVWVARVRLGDALVRVVINGQTGHCVGRLPTSVAKVIGTIVGAVALVLIVLLAARRPAVDVIECDNCGGSIVFDAERASVRCPFCGSESLRVTDLASGPEVPEMAAERAVSLEEARASFHAWATSSWWTPRAFRTATADVTPLWIPAWRLGAEVEATWTGLRDANTKSGRRPVAGADVSRRTVWLPASLGLTQRELDALAPFHADPVGAWTVENTDAPFEVAGLTRDAALVRARDNFRSDARAEIIRTERVRDCRVSIVLEDVHAKAFMLPVYVGCVRFRDRPWRFVVNGQNGRVTGKAPVDRRKAAAAVALVVVGLLAWWWFADAMLG